MGALGVPVVLIISTVVSSLRCSVNLLCWCSGVNAVKKESDKITVMIRYC